MNFVKLIPFKHFYEGRSSLFLQAVIDKVKHTAQQQTTSDGHYTRQAAAALSQRCIPRAVVSQGADVQITGGRCSVDHIVRTACNRLLRAQDRNLLCCFRSMGSLRAPLVKSMPCHESGEDVEVGCNILTVFHGNPAETGVDYMFCVGQVRQISASKSTGKKDRQFWLSVSAEDESALFFCFLWAIVHTTTGSLPFCDEPKE